MLKKKNILANLFVMCAGILTPMQSSLGASKTVQPPFKLRISTQDNFDFPAETVWGLIAGFDSLDDYHPAISKSTLHNNGLIRHLQITDDAGGGIVVERMVSFDDKARTFSYRIIELINCPMPFRNYQAFVHVESTGANSCCVHWGSRFDVEGSTDEEADKLARDIYKGCFDGIKSTLKAKPGDK